MYSFAAPFSSPAARPSGRHIPDRYQLLECISDGYFDLDAEWTITYLNAQAVRLFSAGRENLLHQNYWSVFSDQVGTVFYEQFHKARREQVAVHFEAYLAGMDKWTEVSAYPYQSGLCLFFRDVTERKKAERERHKLSLIAIHTGHMVLITDRMGQIEWVNDAFLKKTGYTLEEALGQHPAQLLHGPETSPDTVRSIVEGVKRGASFRVELINYTKSGQAFWSDVYFQPVLDAEGKVAQYFTLQTDITARKKTEEELQRLSLIARETDNLVIITDARGKIFWVNNAFTKKTGYTLEEALGQHPGTLLRGEGSDLETGRYMSEQILRGKPFQVEILNYTRTKEPYWVEIYAQPIHNKSGAVVQYFAIQTDITERRRLQDQLLQEQRRRQKLVTASIIRAQESVRAKVGLELHDGVSQVLTTVKLYLELCRDGVASSELIDKCIGLVQDSIQEIRTLSRRLSAPMLGKIQLKDSVLEIVNTFAAFNKFAITLDAAAIQELEATKELHLTVYRILQEHLNNILKHAGAQRVQVVFAIQEGHLLLKVVDNGKGFDTTRKRKGIGITNMITRAEYVNGTLSLKSAPGAGCVLQARFPLSL